MNKSLYRNFMLGHAVDIRTQIAIIEGYIYDRKGEVVHIANPDDTFRQFRDANAYEREVRSVSDAFGFICIEVIHDRYLTDDR